MNRKEKIIVASAIAFLCVFTVAQNIYYRGEIKMLKNISESVWGFYTDSQKELELERARYGDLQSELELATKLYDSCRQQRDINYEVRVLQNGRILNSSMTDQTIIIDGVDWSEKEIYLQVSFIFKDLDSALPTSLGRD